VVEESGRLVGFATVVEEYADVMTPADRTTCPPAARLGGEAPGPLEHYVPDPTRARNEVMARAAGGRRGGSGGCAGSWTDACRAGLADGVSVRPYERPRDDVAVHEVITTSFREIGGQHERSLQEWTGYLLDSERFDADLYLVAESGGQVVGAALTQTHGRGLRLRPAAGGGRVAPRPRARAGAAARVLPPARRARTPGHRPGRRRRQPDRRARPVREGGMRVVEQFTRWDRPLAE
jgi:hypothetical protein